MFWEDMNFQEVFSETTGYEGINLTDDSKSFNDPTVIPREFIDLYRAIPITINCNPILVE